MTTAAGLARAVTAGLVEVVAAGEERPVVALELAEPGTSLVAGDLVIGVGVRDVPEAVALAESGPTAAGLLLRRPLAHAPEVAAACAAHGLALLALADGAGWSPVVGRLRAALEQAVATGGGPVDDVYGDLFEMADTISVVLAAPVTIEDATSRVLAYSSGQHDVDEARTSTIVGRQVPRAVREHFRALGVFRRLARSDDPFFVPAGQDDVKPRYVVPVRAGGEWLGSVWAVVDAPVAEAQERELRAAARLIALHLLRLRAHSELHRQVQLDRVRRLLQGGTGSEGDSDDGLGDGRLPDGVAAGPWRVVALSGPAGQLDASARCELWTALVRRHGWRRPVLADLDGVVHAVVGEATGPGTWAWLAEVVVREHRADPAVGAAAGGPVSTVEGWSRSRAQAAELAVLPDRDRPIATAEESWAQVVLARAVRGLGSPAAPVGSPLLDLVEHERAHGGHLVDTLAAVIDHWGEPQRAARVLDVHPNTVRYRVARLAEVCPVDLDDPRQRLAARLLIAQVRAAER
ncbi:PucR family transcriptional regulator [Nocardioides deserti]|uniref:Helix-turn-helix domain-containing protein n=1 Tax=Nocardioides deserti TaxID=1588644 RepID=A0ABR6U5T6_9ACTN|nr:helix-turn-helix domain-containing protein [Nocardioides deserti]MBC2959772.1 helix-turn-helix domain-containing protein [Nocardioides deserti]